MIKPHNTNSEFALSGINHVALVCSDMARTVDFRSNTLGMPLVNALDLPGGVGQHFFFDAGNGDCVAFFWFRDAPDAVPGVSAPRYIPGIGDIVSDESEAQVAAELHPGVYVRSFYFHDPDGITLEFACWVKEFGDTDIDAEPRTAADRRPRVPAGR